MCHILLSGTAFTQGPSGKRDHRRTQASFPLGSNETATRCSAIQMLLTGVDRELVCNALLVTNRALRKWINRFNQCGVDGLIVKKRPGTMAIINDQQGPLLAQLATDVFAVLFARAQPHRAHLAYDQSTLVQ